jgi:hypothetical protein
MRRWIRLAARLYPREWRVRYGAELDALLDDNPARLRDLFNVLGSAIAMQLIRGRYLPHFAAVLVGCAGVVVAVAISATLPRQFESHASLQVLRPAGGDDAGLVRERMAMRVQEVLSKSYLIAFISDPQLSLYEEEIRNGTSLDALAEKMLQDVSITSTASDTVEISFRYRDRLKARRVVEKFTGAIEERTFRIGNDRRMGWKRIRPNTQPPPGETLRTAEQASAPQDPLIPTWIIRGAVGLGAGLVLALMCFGTLCRPRLALHLTIFTALGTGLGIAISLFMPARYTATEFVQISKPVVPESPSHQSDVTADFKEIANEVLMDYHLTWLVKHSRWAAFDEGRIPKQSAARLRHLDLHIRLLYPPTGFEVSVRSGNGIISQHLAHGVATAFQEAHYRRMRANAKSVKETEIAEQMLGFRYETLAMAPIPSVPDPDHRSLIRVAGLAFGLMVGVATMFRRSDPIARAVAQPA